MTHILKYDNFINESSRNGDVFIIFFRKDVYDEYHQQVIKVCDSKAYKKEWEKSIDFFHSVHWRERKSLMLYLARIPKDVYVKNVDLIEVLDWNNDNEEIEERENKKYDLLEIVRNYIVDVFDCGELNSLSSRFDNSKLKQIFDNLGLKRGDDNYIISGDSDYISFKLSDPSVEFRAYNNGEVFVYLEYDRNVGAWGGYTRKYRVNDPSIFKSPQWYETVKKESVPAKPDYVMIP